MKCQICHKNNANIVFTQIVNNEKIVIQICTECAKKKGLSIEFETTPLSSNPAKSFLSSVKNEHVEEEKEKIPDLTCEICGLTFIEFKKKGLLGCDKCHEAFGSHIRKILKQIHGTTVHLGKAPHKDSTELINKQHMKHLRAQLKHCVEIEDYEQAAILRDQIEVLKREKTTK